MNDIGTANEAKGLILYTCQFSVSQPPGRGPVPGPGINYIGPREVLLEFVILVFQQYSRINILQWEYSEENNILECVKKLRPGTPK